ncbi:MAG: 30S ribosomal protein S19e [Desulfurococcaceae archaeon]
MVTALEVPADALIAKLAAYIKENIPEIRPPSWTKFAKTGCFREKPPQNPDWWYYRAASILRKLYKAGRPVGLSELRREYGGRKRRGVAPERAYKAPGNAIRRILQKLEQDQLVRKTREGRVLSPQGKALLDRMAFEILEELTKERPELVKYLPPLVRLKFLSRSGVT